MHIWKSNHTLRWFRSILFVLFPCIFLCIIACIYMIHASRNNILEINSTITNQVQKNIDSHLKELNRYALTIEISSDNTSLKTMEKYPDSMPQPAYHLSNDLRDYLVTNTFVNNTYIYYPKADLLVGNHGCFDSFSYYTLQEYPDSTGYDKWLEALNSASGMSIQNFSFRSRQNICFIHKMETDSNNTAIMVFEINFDQVLQDFTPDTANNVLSIGILENSHLITSVGNQHSLETIDTLYSHWKEEPAQTVVQYNDIYAFFYPSAVPSLTYVTLYTSGQLMKALYAPLAFMLIGVILCAVIGISGAITISIRNGRPLDNLLMSLGGKTNITDDDYQFIIDKFEQMASDKYKSEEFIQKHLTLLNSIFLSLLIRENFPNENEIFKEAERYEVSLESPIYQIIILTSLQEKIHSFSPEIAAIHDHLTQLKYSSLITAYHQRYIILLNTEEPLPDCELQQLVSELQTFIFPDSPCIASIGNWCDNMTQIITSYQNALIPLRKVASLTHNMIVSYTDTEESKHGNLDVMKLFTQLVYSGEFLQARQLLSQLDKEYLTHEQTHTALLRQDALTNLLTDTAYSLLPQPQAAKHVNLLLESASSRDDYLQQIDILLNSLYKVSASPKPDKLSITEQAKQYVDEHFTDPMLGLYMVSEHLGVSNSYLSSTFKKTYGVNIVQYINHLRIEQAKLLILNTQKNIKEIAYEVGFSSDINFIRVFKKMENQTPSMLRKNHSD